MDIVSTSALPVGTLIWELRPGERMLTVCVKVTFSLVDGQTSVLATPQEPIHGDIPWDDTPGAALYAPSDLVPTKPRIDILLSGHVHAPGGRPAPQLVARVAVDDFSKSLLVRGDQRWITASGGLHPGPVQPFVRMPLRHDRAGVRNDDPGSSAPESRALGTPLPHFDRAPGGPGVELPAGFGPLAPGVRARRIERGEEIWRWAESLNARAPVAPPAQLDWAFFNSAPRDQQIAELGPAPRILLENLHPSIPRLETRLPAISPRVLHLEPGKSEVSEIRLRCDTLRIDTDRGRVTLSYRGTLPLGIKDERAVGALGILLEGGGSATTASEIVRLLRARTGIAPAGASDAQDEFTRADAEEDEVGSSTVTGTSFSMASVLPFMSALEGALPLAGPSSVAARPVVTWASTSPVGSPELDDETTEAGRSTLPIAHLASKPALPFSRSDEDAEVGSSTLPITHLPSTPELPFVEGIPAPAPGLASPSASPAPVLAPEPPAPAPLPSLAATEISVELCATITAEIHEGAAEITPILDRHRCSADTWAEAQRLWASAIDQERRRGKSAVQEAHDAAYVAQLERGRGVLQVEDYARLEVGIERGEAAATLAELRLPRQALMPVQRLWLCRLLSEPGLLAKVQRARSAARSA